jgi:AraC-like DNA-binding protein
MWPFDPLFPVDVRFFVFGWPLNTRLTRHDYFELFFHYSGQAVWQIQNRRYGVRENDLVISNGSFNHHVVELLTPQLKAVVLYFLPELLRAKDVAGEDTQYLMPFLIQESDFPSIVSAATGIPDEIFDLMKRIHAELPATSDRARLSVKTYLRMILVLLVNHYAAYRGTRDALDLRQTGIQRLRPLFQLIDEQYSMPIGVPYAAKLVGMSQPHFMRFFKNVTGQPFISYLNHFRIARAQKLLAFTAESISQVSQEVGFCDQSYFGAVFRRLVQMTPRHYRSTAQSSLKDQRNSMHDFQDAGATTVAAGNRLKAPSGGRGSR